MGKFNDFMTKNHEDLMIALFMGVNIILIEFGIIILKTADFVNKDLNLSLGFKLFLIMFSFVIGLSLIFVILFFQVKLSKRGFIKKMFKYKLK